MKLLYRICYIAVFVTSASQARATIDPIEGRYSFSLTTFHPTGKLPQLEHAIKASELGPPVIAVSLSNGKGIILASIQSLPSPLINDDGTSRFVRISKSVIMGHTGVSADGRVLCEAAQRLSVEHTYTFHEEIPVDTLLEEMALLFQEYTMKPGCRPFGCSLIVASINDDSDGGNGCCLYRIDPAGTVTKLESIAFAGRGNGEQMIERIYEAGCMDVKSVEEGQEILKKLLKSELLGIGVDDRNNLCDQNSNLLNAVDESERTPSSTLIFAKLGSSKLM